MTVVASVIVAAVRTDSDDGKGRSSGSDRRAVGDTGEPPRRRECLDKGSAYLSRLSPHSGRSFANGGTCKTPPPWLPGWWCRKCSGSPSIFASQSMTFISSSVHAGLEAWKRESSLIQIAPGPWMQASTSLRNTSVSALTLPRSLCSQWEPDLSSPWRRGQCQSLSPIPIPSFIKPKRAKNVGLWIDATLSEAESCLNSKALWRNSPKNDCFHLASLVPKIPNRADFWRPGASFRTKKESTPSWKRQQHSPLTPLSLSSPQHTLPSGLKYKAVLGGFLIQFKAAWCLGGY